VAAETKRLSFMLVAGETSGDALAAELVQALRCSPQVQAMPFPPEFFGAGGPRLAEAGAQLAVDLTQHAVIGLSDALKKYRQFKRIFDELFQLALGREPDAILCVDFSGFNLRFAHAVKQYLRARRETFLNWQPKLVQYVSPQVWASRPGRARQLERDVDLLLSIFPFEKAWYARHAPGLRVEFVGHPMVDRFAMDDLRWPRASAGETSIANRKSLILLLPGSRIEELRRHLPVMMAAARLIQEARPDTLFQMALPNEKLKRLAEAQSGLPPQLEIQFGALPASLAKADLAIASTGTVTLECAHFGVPAVAIYRSSWSTYLIARLIVQVKYLAMPNLLAGEAIYPEFIQHQATAENITRAALELLTDRERRKTVKTKLAQVIKSLGGPGASERAAKAVLGLVEQGPFPIRASLVD